jgi:uncharacterized protein (UPF0335 family)
MARRGRGERAGRISAAALSLAAVVVLLLASTPAAAETRRAFLIGIERYSDGFIQRLDRTVNDAKDLAKDLEEVGFDKKNIKVVTDLKNRDAFDKEFSAFLKTIESGDTVFFFFSGHGFGVEADQTNYLLFTDLKSPFTFTKTQLTEQERKNADVVRLRIPSFLDTYQQNEIPKAYRRPRSKGGWPRRARASSSWCSMPAARWSRPMWANRRSSSRSSAATIPAAAC